MKRLQESLSFVMMGFVALSVGTFCGCATPQVSGTGTRMDLDEDRNEQGITSNDIRTVATAMCPSILAVPEIANGTPPVRILFSEMKNSSRFFIDRDIFMKRLSVELNRYGRGQVRFLSNNANVGTVRKTGWEDRQSEMLQQKIQKLGQEIVSNPLFANAKEPVKIAVLPVLNTNLVNMNADSFTAMIRSEIANASGGKILFLMPGETEGADYWLTGQFYPESMKTAGILNLAEYIKAVDERIKSGKELYVERESSTVVANPLMTTVTSTTKEDSIYLQMLNNEELKKMPEGNKHLNIMIVRPTDKVSVLEKSTRVEDRLSNKSASANYILAGEISGLTQGTSGATSDYLLITMQLVDIETNEVIWEDAYEVKRQATIGTVYR